jgi:hypothetical protein
VNGFLGGKAASSGSQIRNRPPGLQTRDVAPSASRIPILVSGSAAFVVPCRPWAPSQHAMPPSHSIDSTAQHSTSSASEWLAGATEGYCGSTVFGGSCSTDSKGAWQLGRSSTLGQAVEDCLARCALCERCNYISVSRAHSDCSWFYECDLEHVETTVTGFYTGHSRGTWARMHAGKYVSRSGRTPLQEWSPVPEMSAIYAHEPPALLLNSSLPTERYAPDSFELARSAVYTLWNQLDTLVFDQHNSTAVRAWAFGSFLPIQMEKLVRAVRTPGVRTYCEVGFNGGHTSAAVLAATRDVTVRSFDLGEYGSHTKRNAAFLRSVYPRRFAFTMGDSQDTLPILAARVHAGQEPPCDVILLDGSHETRPALADLENFRRAAAPNALVVLDDLDSPAARAVLSAYREGWLAVHSWYIYYAVATPMPPERIKSKVMFECRACFSELPNLTVTHDPKREVFPCMRWILPGCTPTSWSASNCLMCHMGAAWGLGGFVGATPALRRSRRGVAERLRHRTLEA